MLEWKLNGETHHGRYSRRLERGAEASFEGIPDDVVCPLWYAAQRHDNAGTVI
jgi:rubredoxin